MAIDLSTFSDADLDAIEANDFSRISDEALDIITNIKDIEGAFQQSKLVTESQPSESVNKQQEAVQFLAEGRYKIDSSADFDTSGEFDSGGMTSGERLAKEQPVVLQKVSEAIEIPKEQIDITSGLPGFDRFLMGAKRDDAQILKFLEDNFGQDGGDIREVTLDGVREFVVMNPEKTQGKYVLADEYAPSLKDILDLTREVVVTGAEIGATTFGPGKTKAIPQAIKAGTGVILSNLGLDTLFGSDPDAEEAVRNSIDNAVLEGGLAALTDLGIGLTLKGAIRMRPDAKPVTVDEQAEVLRKAKDEVEGKYGVQFPETYGTRRGSIEALAQEEDTISRYSEGFFAGLAKRAERGRDLVAKLADNLTGLSPRSFEDIYKNFRQSQIERNQLVLKELASRDQLLANATARAISDRVNRLSTGSSTSVDETGNLIRNARNKAFDSVEGMSDELYRDVFTLADERGIVISAADIGKNIQSVIKRLDLPKDIEGEVLNIFKPAGISKLGKQATALQQEQIIRSVGIVDSSGKIVDEVISETAPTVQALSVRQLDNFRKDINKLIKRQINKNNDVSGLIQIQESIQRSIDSSLAKGGDDLVRASENAKQFFVANVLPFRTVGVADLSKTGKGNEYLLSGEQIVNKYFSGARAVENLRELKVILGKNNPALDNLRQAYFNELMSKGQTYDGSIDYLKLNQVAFNADIVKELFGSTALKGFKELDALMRLNDGTNLDENIIKEMTKARFPQDIEAILDLARENIRRRNYINRNSNKLFDLIKSGDVQLENPVDVIVALKTKSSGEVKQFMNALPETGGIRQSFKQEYLNDFMTEAGRGSSTSQKTSRMRGGRDIWDYNRMQKNLNNKKLRANAEAVLGKELVKDLERLNRTLQLYSKSNKAQSKFLGAIRGRLRPGQSSPGLIEGTVNGSYDYIKLRILSAAFSIDVLPKLLNKSKSEEELFAKLLPAVLATSKGIEALVYEADKDPRLLDFIGQHIRNFTEPIRNFTEPNK